MKRICLLMKDLDVCMIPVGGHYTIDGKWFEKIIRKNVKKDDYEMFYL